MNVSVLRIWFEIFYIWGRSKVFLLNIHAVFEETKATKKVKFEFEF